MLPGWTENALIPREAPELASCTANRALAVLAWTVTQASGRNRCGNVCHSNALPTENVPPTKTALRRESRLRAWLAQAGSPVQSARCD